MPSQELFQGKSAAQHTVEHEPPVRMLAAKVNPPLERPADSWLLFSPTDHSSPLHQGAANGYHFPFRAGCVPHRSTRPRFPRGALEVPGRARNIRAGAQSGTYGSTRTSVGRGPYSVMQDGSQISADH